MPDSLPASLLDVELQPRKPPILRADTAGDAPGWAAEQRDALRAVVAEHGAVLVRGLHLRNAPEISAVFRQLSTELMIEKEAFAARRIYPDGVYSFGADVVQLLNQVYEDNTVREPWQAGDLMLVDNIRTAHSREAYEGPREILVGMADPVRLADCSPTIAVTPG